MLKASQPKYSIFLAPLYRTLHPSLLNHGSLQLFPRTLRTITAWTPIAGAAATEKPTIDNWLLSAVRHGRGIRSACSKRINSYNLLGRDHRTSSEDKKVQLMFDFWMGIQSGQLCQGLQFPVHVMLVAQDGEANHRIESYIVTYKRKHEATKKQTNSQRQLFGGVEYCLLL